MNRITLILLVSLLSISCASIDKNENSIKLNATGAPSIVGIWAMYPLNNGIANVVEFTKDGKSNLHPFDCREKSTDPVESSTYSIDESGKNIRLVTDGEIQNLKLISMTDKELNLGQSVGEELLKFSYLKVSRISPLCFLYKKSNDEKSKRAAYKESDFIHAPWIPENKNILRYVGKWANEKDVVQIQVKRDADGRYMVFLENNENWTHLYNEVRWSDSGLQFESFAYSTRAELYDHPYHKSKQAVILAEVNDLNKIKWSFFIRGQRYDYTLSKKE